uniref:J domain-containing protein n=1 Tax=Mesocestoides corti TaxID=53468 RepID=A0A5K3F6W5_MESCO
MVPEVDVDLYAYLGLTYESSIKEIKRAYKVKAKELHPDKNKNDPRATRVAAAKRHSELDDERRRLRDVLEAREKEAAFRRAEALKIIEREKVAERFRNEWVASKEAAIYAARREHAKNAKSTLGTSGCHTVVRIKWKRKEGNETYDKEFLHTCLSEFGTVSNLVLGKKNSAVAEFSSEQEAEASIRTASFRAIGFPDNPLTIHWAGDYPLFEKPTETDAMLHPRPSSPLHQKCDNVS